METISLPNSTIEVEIRRSARARRLSLRVSRLDGRVSMTLPKGVPLAEAQRFASGRAEWISAQLQTLPAVQNSADGLPFRGQMLTVRPAAIRSARRAGDTLLVPEAKPHALQVWLREEARRFLTEASERYAHQLGRSYNRITLRDTRSRWGSCSSTGGLMYSWRLIMAPDHVADYVAAHEVAHLVHMDHSPAFWSVVGMLRPDWRRSRDWLRDEGGRLHRVNFGN